MKRAVILAPSVAHSPRRELALVLAGFSGLATLLTLPLALHPGSQSYEIASNFDAQFSVWNVAWVAHALLVDPLGVFNANIFYPHKWTLAYSETNLGAGALATPIYWATRNPYAAHNLVVVISFVMSASATYYLIRHLTGERRAAVVGAVCFAFCPHVLAHLAHIQLLMTAGLPLGLLAFHRLADRPTAPRGAVLGLVMAGQAYFCAYYAVFAMLLVGFAVLVTAGARRLWHSREYWTTVGLGACVAIAAASPLIAVYGMIQRTTGFSRSVDDAGSFAANWSAYFASSSYAHAWMLAFLPAWHEVLFPGFVALVFGFVGALAGWRVGGRQREVVVLYAGAAALAFWESFGPSAGLYRVTYAIVPGFSFLRAPSRFGVLVALSFSVLAGLGVSRATAKTRVPALAAAILAFVAAAESRVPLRLAPVPAANPAYERLAALPYGAVLELPLYSEQFAYIRVRYMLGSTRHWMPLVDAYSDYIPQDFRDAADVLGEFPTSESIATLREQGVRYAVIHTADYGGPIRQALDERLAEFAPALRRLYADERTSLYEIIAER